MFIIDNDCQQGCPTSRMILKKEYMDLFPEAVHPRVLSYIFKYKVPMEIEDNIGKVLLSKYPTLETLGEPIVAEKPEDDLEDMKYNDLRVLAMRYGWTGVETQAKKNELMLMIKESRKLGETPISIEEHKKNVEIAKEQRNKDLKEKYEQKKAVS